MVTRRSAVVVCAAVLGMVVVAGGRGAGMRGVGTRGTGAALQTRGPVAELAVEEWSKVNSGMQGRIVLSLGETDGVNIWTRVEFKSVLGGAIAVSTHPRLSWRLVDAQGREVATGVGIRGGGMGGGELPEQWMHVLGGAGTVTVRVRPNGAFFVTPGMRVLAVQTEKWAIPPADEMVWGLEPGEYELSGTVACEKKAEGPTNQWVGKLELPAVRFKVTAPK